MSETIIEGTVLAVLFAMYLTMIGVLIVDYFKHRHA